MENIPEHFNYGVIYNYIYESATLASGHKDDPMDFATAKPFERAEKYIDSKYITDVKDIFTGENYFAKSKIKSSFTDKFHFIHVTISKIGSIWGIMESKFCFLESDLHVP